ncbi:MAG: NlpC/P60 family protein [Actinobacteria bacterium]|nr:NlpC/P60 family protein [Actinomycetota bacterium]
MSIARPTAMIRRAVALPIGLLDRIEASLDAALDAGFARVDRALDRRISAVADRTSSVSQGLARSAKTFDRALDQRVTKLDSRSASRVAKAHATADRIETVVLNLEARTDAKLNRSLHKVDRATAASTRAAIATMNASVALTHRADNKITRGFDRVDVRATNVANRAHSRRIKTANLTVRATTRIDQRIETDFARADARVNAGINHTANAIDSAVARVVATTNATDTRIANAVTRVDARIDRRIGQGVTAAANTINLVNTKALAFERVMDLGISRVDSRIANGQARAIATSVALTNGVTSADQAITSAYARVDKRVDNRIAQATYAYAQAAAIATNRVAATDAKFETSLASFDARVATGVATLVTAATGISNFVVDHVADADSALTDRMSRIDARADELIDLVNGQPGRHASQPRTSLPWAATSLTLVLGTLGAATGASVVNASVTGEIDTTVKIEATAAKDAVTQYLSVRDSFQALQASRSRTIQTLEQEIAAAQARMTTTGLDGAAVVDIADNYGGVPYVRGGTTPKGFDCSGYTSYVFRQLGVELPRTSQAQKAFADPVSFEDRQVGDLMFWQYGGLKHVGIYAGEGMMWDSPRPGRRVGKIAIWGTPTYGRVPIAAINAAALEDIAEKTAALEEVKAQAPQL